MENVVLGLLIIQSLTLYELNQSFKRGISMFYSASYGSLQIAVKNLLSKGLIVFEERVESGRNKKIYSITEGGKETFFAWMFAKIPTSKLEVTALSKVYFLGLIPDGEQRKHIVQEILDKTEMAQTELIEMDAQLSQLEIPPEYWPIFKFQRKTLDYGVRAHGFAQAWFSALLNDLKDSSDSN